MISSNEIYLRRNILKNYFDLSGQVAIVTGCSAGLGVQMAKALANQGAAIVAVARRQDKIEAVAKEIAETYGVKTLAVKCDITDTAMTVALLPYLITFAFPNSTSGSYLMLG